MSYTQAFFRIDQASYALCSYLDSFHSKYPESTPDFRKYEYVKCWLNYSSALCFLEFFMLTIHSERVARSKPTLELQSGQTFALTQE